MLELLHDAAYREAWFAETGQPLPASIDFCVSRVEPLCRVLHIRYNTAYF